MRARRKRHAIVRRRRALRRRDRLGVVFAGGALVAALGTLHEVGQGAGGGAAWGIAFVSCLVLAWIAERP